LRPIALAVVACLASFASSVAAQTTRPASSGVAVATAAATRRIVRFRTAPADAYIVDASAAGVDTRLRLSTADNGGRTAELAYGVHELVLIAEGYRPARVTVDVVGTGLVVEAKLERAASVLRLVAVVPTDARPKSVAYTPDGRRLVVAPLSGSRIDVLDARTGALVATPAPPEPWAGYQGFVEIAFPYGRGECWVSQMYTDRIHVFSLEDFSYLRTVRCGGVFPKVLLAHPDGRVFVSNWLSETVSALSPDGSVRLGSMRTTGTPRGVALSLDGGTLYVANFSGGTIEAFDASTYGKLEIPFGGEPGSSAGGAKRHLVVDAVKGRLYASDMGRGSVFAYDLTTGRTLAEIVVAPNAKTNTIAISPDGRWLYASTRGPNNAVDYERKGPAFGELIVIDTERLVIVERHWGGNQPTGLAVSPDGRDIVFTDFLDHRLEIYRRVDPLAPALEARDRRGRLP
jgi:DNA-binding beta-propeller fold protein YncE